MRKPGPKRTCTRGWPAGARALSRVVSLALARAVSLATARAVVGVAVAGAVVASCSSVELGDPPADVNACRPSQALFVEQIWPNFLLKPYGAKTCGDASCHGPSSSRALRITAPTSTPAPTLPFAAGTDWDVLYRSVADQVNCSDIAASELYTKPCDLHDHQGGKLFEPNGPELALLTAWVAGP